jgi:hypothetical protein
MSSDDFDADRLSAALQRLMRQPPPPFNPGERPRRWFASLLVAAGTALLVGAVLTTSILINNHLADQRQVTPPRAVATARPPTVSPDATKTPSVVYAPPVGPPCSAAQLAMSVGSNLGAAGSGLTYLVLTDRGNSPCVLKGTPVVAFLDLLGHVVEISVRDQPSGSIPTIPNDGVGLLPMSSPEDGVSGQADLPLQYGDFTCNNAIASVRVTIGSGSLSVPIDIFKGVSGCPPLAVIVNPFQPAAA